MAWVPPPVFAVTKWRIVIRRPGSTHIENLNEAPAMAVQQGGIIVQYYIFWLGSGANHLQFEWNAFPLSAPQIASPEYFILLYVMHGATPPIQDAIWRTMAVSPEFPPSPSRHILSRTCSTLS